MDRGYANPYLAQVSGIENEYEYENDCFGVSEPGRPTLCEILRVSD